MNYYPKFSKRNSISIIWLFICVYSCLKYYHKHDMGLYYFYLSLTIFWVVVVLPQLSFILYTSLFKKPVFSVNEFFIFDHYRNIKYYWNDIDEVISSDAYLEILLYHPDQYLKKIGNPLFRVAAFVKYNIFRGKLSFKIDMDLISIKKGENGKFVKTINDYSIQDIDVKEN